MYYVLLIECICSTLFTIERATELTTVHFPEVKPTLRKAVQDKFTSHAASLMLTVEQLQIDHNALNMRYMILTFQFI